MAAKKQPPSREGADFLLAAAGNLSAIRAVVGHKTYKTLREVAHAFGVTFATVKATWRPAGMPGAEGKYELAAILFWKLSRAEGAASPAAGRLLDGQQLSVRKKVAEARNSEAAATARERENLEKEGNLLHRDDVERQICEMIIAARENFLRLPREMLPRFPKQLAQDLADEIRKRIEKTCTQMSEFKMDWRSGDKE